MSEIAKPASGNPLAQFAPKQAGMTNYSDTSGGSPYVGFASPKSPKWDTLKAAIPTLKDGDPYYNDPKQGPILLAPLRYHLIQYAQYWAKLDENNKPVRVLAEDPRNWGHECKEHVETVILAFIGDRVVPTVATFRSVKAGGVTEGIKALKLAATPDWAKKSPEHKSSMAVAEAFGRFVVTVETFTETAKGTGRKMVKAKSTVKPVTPAEAKLLLDSANTPEFAKEYKAATELFARRLKVLQDLVGKD